jgi:hypothetical protein
VTWGGEPLIDIVDPSPLVAAGFAGIRLRANARISNFIASA